MILFKVEITGGPKVMKRDLGRLKKAAFTEALTLWHRRFRAAHFTTAGAKKYGYKPRKGSRETPAGRDRRSRKFKRSYTGQKLRLMGHELPLVFSGEGRALSKNKRIQVTGKGGKAKLPRKFNWRNPHSDINMREELTNVLSGERNEMVGKFGGTLKSGLANLRERETVVIK